MNSARNLAHSRAGCQGHSQYRPDPHHETQTAIARSRPGQYRLSTDGRKWRSQCLRRQRCATYLAGYRQCFPGLKRIARDLAWSRRTTARVLAELKTLGVMKPLGYTAVHGTRIRVLDARALRFLECGTPASRECGTQELPGKNHKKPEHDEHDTTRQKTAAVVVARTSVPANKVQKPFRTPRQVFETAERLIGPEYAAWIYYRAIKAGREAWESFAQCVPKSVAYYVKSYRNFCLQFGPQQHQAILENAADRMQAEQKLWVGRSMSALDRIPRCWPGDVA